MNLAIIGGTGSYNAEQLTNIEKLKVMTPYGMTFDLILKGSYNGKEIFVLNRHGSNHTIPPHKINFKANIWALKELGVDRIIATVAVGSLKEEYKAKDN